MVNFLEINTVVINIIVGLIILLVILGDLIRIYLNRKATIDVIEALEKYFLRMDDKFTVTKSNAKYYDLACENDEKIIYIKILHNQSNSEICVNNATRWQIRKSKKDTRFAFLKDVEPFMNHKFDAEEAKNKKVKKIYIIYKDSRSLLMYVNESEMIFIDPLTDVYGTRVIPFNDLVNEENLDLLY